jgi:hypothetical protein
MLEPVRGMVSQRRQAGSMKKKYSAKAEIKVITDPKKLAWLQVEIEKRKIRARRVTRRNAPVSPKK